jgi:hypothetical protein
MRLYAANLHSTAGAEKNVKPLFPRKEMTLPGKVVVLTQNNNSSKINLRS